MGPSPGTGAWREPVAVLIHGELSLRARGAAGQHPGDAAASENISTGAEGDPPPLRTRCAPLDHPCGYRKQVSRRRRKRRTLGLSPRVREAVPPPAARRLGISPRWDHPRRRGEQPSYSVCWWAGSGLSLRARGAVAHVRAPLRPKVGPSPRAQGEEGFRVQREVPPGTISAGAGSRRPTGCWRRAPRDHPCKHAEQEDVLFVAKPLAGPSLRVRGAVQVLSERTAVEGTIPESAGPAPGTCHRGGELRDHPQGRGEQTKTKPNRAFRMGASPRDGEQQGLRITDTCPECQPRERREQALAFWVLACDWGHSRMRRQQHEVEVVGETIPASAGRQGTDQTMPW